MPDESFSHFTRTFIYFLGLLLCNSNSGALADEPPYISPLPAGSTTWADNAGHLKRCEPPPGQHIENFKDLCRKFLEDNRLVRIAVPKNRSSGVDWITADDYPAELRGSGKQGTVVIEIAVSADGTLTDCQIRQTSGYTELDEAACRATLQKAKFLPKLGRDGMPIASTYTRAVRWVSR